VNCISVCHSLSVTEVPETTECGSLRWNVVRIEIISFDTSLLVWVHVGVDTCWAETDGVDCIFEFVGESFSHEWCKNFRRGVNSQAWHLSVSADGTNEDQSGLLAFRCQSSSKLFRHQFWKIGCLHHIACHNIWHSNFVNFVIWSCNSHSSI